MTKESVYIRKELNSPRIGLVRKHQHEFWKTNMAAMTSSGKGPYIVLEEQYKLIQVVI